MRDTSKQNYLHGAAILAAGVIITKILGAIYKIPLGNILGDEGYAHFMVAYNLYNVFFTLATAGFPVALSRMISEADTLHKPMQMRRTFHVALVAFACIGLLSSLIMYLFPTELAVLMDDVEAAQCIWAIAPSMLFVCLAAAYKGYAQGQSNMKPTTVAQVLEMLVKTIVGLVLAWYLAKLGKGLPIAAGGAIFGVTAGSVIALLYLFVYKRRHYPDRSVAEPDAPTSAGRIVKELLRIGIPITLGSSVLSLINLIDAKLVLNRLQTAAGFSYHDAKILYGIYGKAQTLYNLPAAFVVPLTISIVPAITAFVVRKKYGEAAEVAESAIRISGVIALPMGIGMAVLSAPIMGILYPTGHASGVMLLTLLGGAAFFVCLASITTAVLQASQRELYPVLSMLVGGVVKIVVNWLLVGDPRVNIYGAPIGTLVCYIVMCLMNRYFIRRHLQASPRVGSVLIRPAISAVIMGAAVWCVYHGCTALLGGNPGWKLLSVITLLSVAVGVATYLAAIVKTRAITAADLGRIPHGDRLAVLLHIQ